MKEGAFVKNYFAHCVDVEELYENMVSPVCEKIRIDLYGVYSSYVFNK